MDYISLIYVKVNVCLFCPKNCHTDSVIFISQQFSFVLKNDGKCFHLMYFKMCFLPKFLFCSVNSSFMRPSPFSSVQSSLNFDAYLCYFQTKVKQPYVKGSLMWRALLGRFQSILFLVFFSPRIQNLGYFWTYKNLEKNSEFSIWFLVKYVKHIENVFRLSDICIYVK